jgi:hypothetical protein
MDTVIRSVNYIKTCPLKNRLFSELCKEMGAQYQSLLFYCNSCWLSRGNVVACVYNLLVAAALFLGKAKLAHLSYIFWEVQYHWTQVCKGTILTLSQWLTNWRHLLGSWACGSENKKTLWKQVTLELISVFKITWLICSPGFVKYFPEAVPDKYKCISDPFHADPPELWLFSWRRKL